MHTTERRQTPRIPLNRTLLARLPNQEKFFGTTSDISQEGLGFYTATPLPEGAVLTVQLDLPDAEQTPHALTLEGFVSHCVDTFENGYHIGLQLRNPPQDFEQLITHLIQRSV